jgi:hypothetical protein
MSRGKAASRTNVEDAAPEVGILVRYRVVRGPVDVDQRLTVFEDGAVVLDERHRTRDAIRLQLDAAELEESAVRSRRYPTRSGDRRFPAWRGEG